jgi:hypothetical protein
MGPAGGAGELPRYEVIVVFPGREPLTLRADEVMFTVEDFEDALLGLPPGRSLLYVPAVEAEALAITRRPEEET